MKKYFLLLTIILCLSFISCEKKTEQINNNLPSEPNNLTLILTLDLEKPEYSILKTKGRSLKINDILITYSNEGKYIAVASQCTHEAGNLVFNNNNNHFICQKHGAEFDTNGFVKKGPATKSIEKYYTKLTGSILSIYKKS